MDYENVIDERTDPEALKNARENYINNPANDQSLFACSHAMIGSSQKSDIRQGIAGFEKLLRGCEDSSERRSYVFYLALGHARLKSYDTAIRFIDALLEEEPRNAQAKSLKEAIKSKMTHDGLIGAAIVGGGVAAAVAGAVALISLVRK